MKNSVSQTSLLTALMAFANNAIAQAVPVTPVNCDGNQTPDWEGCASMYNTIRGSTNFWINNYPACVGVLPPGDIDPNDVDCTIAYCPKSADVQNTYSVTDGDFDLIRNRCDTNGEGAGGGYQNERYSLQVYKNLNYRPPVAKRNETRAHPRDVGARQADGDNGFTLFSLSRSVERFGIEVTGRLPSGSTHTITQADAKTEGISGTGSLSATPWGIFTGSVNLQLQSSHTVTSTVGDTIRVDCPAGWRGQLFWYPLYDVYTGFFTPSQTNAEYVIPIAEGPSLTNYRVLCFER